MKIQDISGERETAQSRSERSETFSMFFQKAVYILILRLSLFLFLK